MDPSSYSADGAGRLDRSRGRAIVVGSQPIGAPTSGTLVRELFQTPERVASLGAAIDRCIAVSPAGFDALRCCAREARRGGIKPEHMAMAIHELWTLRRPRELVGAATEHALLRAIDIALDAYFEPSADD